MKALAVPAPGRTRAKVEPDRFAEGRTPPEVMATTVRLEACGAGSEPDPQGEVMASLELFMQTAASIRGAVGAYLALVPG